MVLWRLARDCWQRFSRRCRFTKAERQFFVVRACILCLGLVWVIDQWRGWRFLPKVDYLPAIFLVALAYTVAHLVATWLIMPRLEGTREAEEAFRDGTDRIAFGVAAALVTAMCYFSRDPLSPCVALFLWIIAVATVKGGLLRGLLAAVLCTSLIVGVAICYWRPRALSLPGDIALIALAAFGFVLLVHVLQQQREGDRERHDQIQTVTRAALADIERLMRPLADDEHAPSVFDQALQVTLDRTLELAQTDRGYICTIDEANRRPVAKVLPTDQTPAESTDHINGCLDGVEPPHAGVVTHVFRTGEPYVVNFGLSDDPYYKEVWSDSRSELAVPIAWNGKPVAVVNVEQQEENAFPFEVMQAVQDFADSVSHVLSFATQWDELRVLHGLSQKLQPANGLHQCLGQVLDILREYGQYRVVCIWLRDDTRNVFVLKRHFGLEGLDTEPAPILPVEETMAGDAYGSGDLLFVPDIEKHRYPAESFNGPMGAVFLPLKESRKNREVTTGVMGFYAGAREVLPTEEARFLRTIAGITQRVVASARQFEELQAYQDITKALAEAPTNLAALLEVATEKAREIVDAEACVVLLVDDVANPTELKPSEADGLTSDGWRTLEYRLGDGSITDRVAQDKKPYLTADVRREKGCNVPRLDTMEKCIKSGRIGAWIAVPILSPDSDSLLGIIRLFNKERRSESDIDWFGVLDQSILEIIARQIALAMGAGEWWQKILGSITDEVMVLNEKYEIVFANSAKRTRYPHLEEGHKCWEYWPKTGGWAITMAELIQIAKEGVPVDILRRLVEMEDWVFNTEEEFQCKLGEVLPGVKLSTYRDIVNSCVRGSPSQKEPCKRCAVRNTLTSGKSQRGLAWSWRGQSSLLSTALIPRIPGHLGRHVVEVCSPTMEGKAVGEASLALQAAKTEDDVAAILIRRASPATHWS